MITISVANQKGGVGKTTTAVCLAEALERRGIETLLIDLDSQRNATRWSLGGKVPPADFPTTYELIAEDDTTLSDVVVPSSFGYELAPGGEMLSAIDSKMTSKAASHTILRQKLAEHKSKPQSSTERRNQVCLIDCPASFGTLVVQAISASDNVIIPVEVEGMSMQGLGQFLDTLRSVRDNSRNHSLDILGILANNFDLRRKITKSGLADLREEFSDLMFETEIPMRTQIMEAATNGQTVPEYADGDEPQLIEDFTDEVIHRANLKRYA